MSNKNGMDLIRILAGAYLIYLGVSIFRDYSGETGSLPFGVLFIVAGAVICAFGVFRIMKRK